jgi:hypothetical protein
LHPENAILPLGAKDAWFQAKYLHFSQKNEKQYLQARKMVVSYFAEMRTG